jgi:SAM-dependent MidA family methyltransferase
MIEQSGGKISFQDFMQTVLFEPGLGYYRCGTEKFGQLGDFITAPESSPLFGQCLAKFIQQLKTLGHVMEVGAGSGQLAVTILKRLDEQAALPDRYYILELSSELRERQRLNIQQALPGYIENVIWLDNLPEKFKGVVIANELLDAMPVTRFKLDGKQVFEEYVVWSGEKLDYTYEVSRNQRLLTRINELVQQTSIDEAELYHSEVNFMAEDWIKSLAEHMESGVALIIDYGYPRNGYYHAQRYMGTLMCHYQHRAHPDPLLLPGIQDITAHIDFTAMADAALESGLGVVGFASQAHFLLNIGLLSLIDPEQQNLPDYLKASGEVKRLTLPGEMGESFKVMAFSKNYDGDVIGFEQHDIRHLL